MNIFINKIFIAILIGGMMSCENSKESSSKQLQVITEIPTDITIPKDMVWIPGDIYERGATLKDKFARFDEKPVHTIAVDGFFMDITEVTNVQFQKFIDATGYKTVAEQKIDWNELKKQLPTGVKKPLDSLLQPGSLIFHCCKSKITNLNDYSQWWQWKLGVNWKHPEGEDSDIIGKENYPVVHVSYEDAVAYCKWAKRRLPTEAEWELAARSGQKNIIYTWGNDKSLLHTNANTWQGVFPTQNTKKDEFERVAPVKSFPPNPYGLYDMAGNVWEFTQDWYDYNYYKKLAQLDAVQKNPMGPKQSFNPNNPYDKEKTIRGGSFLCHESYCASYRISARMATSIDSGLEHLGFRTVATLDILRANQ